MWKAGVQQCLRLAWQPIAASRSLSAHLLKPQAPYLNEARLSTLAPHSCYSVTPPSPSCSAPFQHTLARPCSRCCPSYLSTPAPHPSSPRLLSTLSAQRHPIPTCSSYSSTTTRPALIWNGFLHDASPRLAQAGSDAMDSKSSCCSSSSRDSTGPPPRPNCRRTCARQSSYTQGCWQHGHW